MKRILALGLVAIISLTGFTLIEEEKKGIQFFEGTFKEALEKAKAEDKLIFLDAYASWCRPCKMMSAYVFTKPEVGEYYNEHFINVKMDMEKGEGPNLARQLKVTAYPTFFYINGDGQVKYFKKGYIESDDLLKLGAQINKKK